jgi:hypothetical protein
MAGLNPKVVQKSLKKKGFKVSNGADKYFEFCHNGKFILHTYTSHGTSHDIGDYLIHKMAFQCKLDKKDFLDLVNCPMDKEKYIGILEKKGVLK